ncbi:hypothetical protein [Nostoc sp.]|uniref:hypothetical protein n=1 Tax=Nostoc sp. TaxID=1180 RepID=UPI002FFA33C5
MYSDSLEETVKSLLQLLGKVNRPYLTAVEEKLLTLLESEYGRIPGTILAIWHPIALGCSFNGDITTMGQRRSCTRDRAKLSASGVPCYASCQMSGVESLYIIDTALNGVQFPLYNWLEMNKTK